MQAARPRPPEVPRGGRFGSPGRRAACILDRGRPMGSDWGTAMVIDPRRVRDLERDNARLRTATRWLRRVLCFALGGVAVSSGAFYWTSWRATEAWQGLRDCRKNMTHANVALSALSRSQENILAATEQAPSVGTKSWGRRFTVTRYLPRSPKYGKFDDGITSTLIRADPKARIVAVDPKLIPYGSWVWIEDLGWFRAEDCGVNIKGFRLDLLTATEHEALGFGRQERFAMVVPADA